MALSRRQFIWQAAASSVGMVTTKLHEGEWSYLLHAQSSDSNSSGAFRHGVASGDPLTDRVVLWTRVTPTESSSTGIDVEWRIATDPSMDTVAARGNVRAASERDFTVKVDVGNLQPGRTYYYAFYAGGQRSPIGRTKTLPAADAARCRLALLCCSNYPSGFFNVYRCVANRADLDAVVHVGDYIYEFENGRYR